VTNKLLYFSLTCLSSLVKCFRVRPGACPRAEHKPATNILDYLTNHNLRRKKLYNISHRIHHNQSNTSIQWGEDNLSNDNQPRDNWQKYEFKDCALISYKRCSERLKEYTKHKQRPALDYPLLWPVVIRTNVD
jgi:hypothetical protein